MNIISLATIKNQKSIFKVQYGKYLAAFIWKNMLYLKEIKTSILDEAFDFFYKVNKPLTLNQKEDIYFSNAYEDIFNSYNNIVMEKGHIYKLKVYKMTYNNLNDISADDNKEIIEIINENENKILLEIIDLYNYLKDEMILNIEEFSSGLGIKKYCIVLESEEKLKEFINKIIRVKVSKEVLTKALITTRHDLADKALKEREGWTSLRDTGYKSFELYTGAYESYNKFKYENNYTEDLKTFLIDSKEDEIKEVIPELTNKQGNLVNERIGCFINLYEDLDKNKDYYKILKEAVTLKTREKLYNLNFKEVKEEINNKIKTKALYIARENMNEYIISSIKSRGIKRYINSTDKETPIIIKDGSEKFPYISKNEYIKSLDTDKLKKKIIKDEDLDNLNEYLYYFNDESSKEELKTLLVKKFDFDKDNVKLFIDNILNNQYYLSENNEEISDTIKVIDNKGYIFITYNKYFNMLEDDLLRVSRYKEIEFKEIKEHIKKYALVFSLDKIDELITVDNLKEVFGEPDRLVNLKDKLEKEDVIPGRAFIAEKFTSKENENLDDGEYQELCVNVKYMSDEEYADKLKEIQNIKSSQEYIDYLISRYYDHNLNEEERKEAFIEIEDICKKVAVTAEFYGDSGLIDPFLYKIIKSNRFLEENNHENHLNIILNYVQESTLHSVNLKENDNLHLCHDIFQILTGAQIENGELIGGSQIIVNADDYKNSIFPSYINAICNNIQDEKEAEYINDLLKKHTIFENEKIQKVNGRYKIIENLRGIYSRTNMIQDFTNIIDHIKNSFVNEKIKYAINEIKVNHSGMMDICIINNKDKLNPNVELNYESLQAIDMSIDNIYKELNNYVHLFLWNPEPLTEEDIYGELSRYNKNHSERNLDTVAKRYFDYMLQNADFIFNMEQWANINIALIGQNNLSRYRSKEKGNDFSENDSNDSYENNKRTYEDKLKRVEIREINLDKVITEKGYILPDEMSQVFKDIEIKDGSEVKINAYRINVEDMHLYNPLYKDLFFKDINGRYIYGHLSNNYEPEEYAFSHDIKPEISEIIIPAFKSKAFKKGLGDKLLNLKKKSAELINTLYKLNNCSHENNVSFKENNVSEKEMNKAYEDQLLVRLKNKAQRKLKDYYEALIYEINDNNGYFKRSLKATIENSAYLKISNVAVSAGEKQENYAANMYRNAASDHKHHGSHYVNPKDMFGENYKSAYHSIGKQLITDKINKSHEFYNYMKESFMEDIKNTHDIHIKGGHLLKDNSTLEKIGEEYLKEIGISSMLLSDLDKTSPSIHFVKTYVNDNVSKGYTHLDPVTNNKLKGQKVKAFFDGIRKSENGKYFLRSKDETQDINEMMKALENINYEEFKKEYGKYSRDKMKPLDINESSAYKEHKNNNHIKHNEKADILQELLEKQNDKLCDYNYCLNKGRISYLERNEDSKENLKINKNIDDFMNIFEKSIAVNEKYTNSEHIKQKLKISDYYINSMNALCNLKDSEEYRAEAFENLKKDTFFLYSKEDSNILISDMFDDLKKVIEDPKANSVIHENFYEKGIIVHNKRTKRPLYKKMDKVSKRFVSKVSSNKNGIFKEVYSRNYGENYPIINGRKVLKGYRIYSENSDDAVFFKVLDTYRNKKGNAELKLQDVQRSKVKRIQGKSFGDISSKLNYYKIAPQNKTDEIILDEIKDRIKEEYITKFSKSFEIIDKVFNNIHSDNSVIYTKVFKEIRKEYDKDKVIDYVNTIQVLKNRNMITEEEMEHISEKMINQLKKSGEFSEKYRENLHNLLKKSRRFKERNIDTVPKVEKFLKSVITSENIENARIIEAAKKAEQYPIMNINKAEDILKEDVEGIIKNLSVKDRYAYEAGKDVANNYIRDIKLEDKNNKEILNKIYKENAHNPEFLDKVLNINGDSTKDVESIKKVKIGYGKHAGLSIGELSNRALSEILKKDYSDKLNYKVNRQLLKKTKDVIYNAKRLNKDGIINKEGKEITKEKLKSRLGNYYVSEMQKLMNEKIKEKGRYRRQESSMYKEASQAVKSAFITKPKNTDRAVVMRQVSNNDLINSSLYSEKKINTEPNVATKQKENIPMVRDSINNSNASYSNVPKSDTRYYAEQRIGNAINISAQAPSKSTNVNMSQLISKAIGGSSLNINTNYTDSRSMVTRDEINSMIENSIK